MANPFVNVVNLGCRVNRVESDRITQDLARKGFLLVEPDEAELIVVNTCAVTGEAEAKTRKAVRQALARAKEPYVVVTGCAVNLHPDMLTELGQRVICEPSKVSVADRACNLLGIDAESCTPGSYNESDLSDLLGRTRLGVKIQDGCNNRCTYCIVWKARGPERSVPAELVLEQVHEAAESGIPEVVLTGVNLGTYDGVSDNDSHVEIDELIRRILNETSIPHIRLGSVEPMDLDERLVPVMAENARRVAPFLHLPVQSLCTRTLERMGRRYTAEEFEDLVARVRKVLPQAAISCDLIVGFPGETEGEFSETLERAARIGFSRMHVFRYSARPGTPAAEMPDQVEPEVMAERSKFMRSLAEDMARSDARARIGTVERAVVENGAYATLGSYHRAFVDNVDELSGARIADVAIISMDETGLLHVKAL